MMFENQNGLHFQKLIIGFSVMNNINKTFQSLPSHVTRIWKLIIILLAVLNFENCTFQWRNSLKTEEFSLNDINLKVKEGEFVAIIGDIGAGKSSLISALNGEMILKSGIIEKNGIELSGGQKQRISLARAIFNESDIYIFDDPLSSVDSNVGTKIFQMAIGPKGILKSKDSYSKMMAQLLNVEEKKKAKIYDHIAETLSGLINHVRNQAEKNKHQKPVNTEFQLRGYNVADVSTVASVKMVPAMQMLQLSQPPKFGVSSENRDKRWSFWIKEFEAYTTAVGLGRGLQKSAVLLHCAGPDVQKIADSLCVGATNNYDDVVKKLTEYFSPVNTVRYERYKLHQLQQRRDENIDDYVTRLRLQAAYCELQCHNCRASLTDDRVLDVLVSNTSMSHLRSRVFEKGISSLDSALITARSLEVSSMRSTEMDNHLVSARNDFVEPTISYSNSHSTSRSHSALPSLLCSSCSLEHHPQHRFCPAFGKKCFKCGAENHFASCCKVKPSMKPKTRWLSETNFRKSNLNNVNTDPPEQQHTTTCDSMVGTSYSDMGYAYLEGPRQVKIDLKIVNGRKASFLVDTGATDNIISHSFVPSYCTLRPAPVIHCFGNFKVKPLGQTIINIQIPDGSVHAVPFQVVDFGPNILGLEYCEKFNFVQIKVNMSKPISANKGVSGKEPGRVKGPVDDSDNIYDESNAFFNYCLTSLPLTLASVQKETLTDRLLPLILTHVRKGWGDKNPPNTDLAPYWKRRKELFCLDDVLFWGRRIVIPESMRSMVLKDLHKTHQGIVKMKNYARLHVWWPGIESDIEEIRRTCEPCQSVIYGPADQLFLGRTIRGKLSTLHPSSKSHIHNDSTHNFKINQPVWIRDYRNPLKKKWQLGTVVGLQGKALIIVNVNGQLLRRHLNQARRRCLSRGDVIWMVMKTQFISRLMCLVVGIAISIYRNSIEAGTASLVLYFMYDLTYEFTSLLKVVSLVKRNEHAFIRVFEYTELPKEDEWEKENPKTETKSKIKYSKIEFIDFSARYTKESPDILQNLNFEIRNGEKIGIVGRTGAGKSSLIAAIFRMVKFQKGKIMIDNVNINNIGLHNLRSKITFIPQKPFLFSGTIRENLDPSGKYSKQDIIGILSKISFQNQTFKIELDDIIEDDGNNISSMGQRQLVCLARAILNKTDIIIFDEATASVDVTTDRLIQKIIKTEFKDKTVITIAHRISTILYSTRIFVMDGGKIIEKGSPGTLLKDQNSTFHRLAKNSEIFTKD
ncbi:Multidrug resistance-associated protein 1 [Nymphon striatum]|nr:Multidrug resistance-associated protein 1 [Nymphon striatum]KAG1661200.1 Multidrug resistance-associated protein 1 [Nymphon striatum]